MNTPNSSRQAYFAHRHEKSTVWDAKTDPRKHKKYKDGKSASKSNMSARAKKMMLQAARESLAHNSQDDKQLLMQQQLVHSHIDLLQERLSRIVTPSLRPTDPVAVYTGVRKTSRTVSHTRSGLVQYSPSGRDLHKIFSQLTNLKLGTLQSNDVPRENSNTEVAATDPREFASDTYVQHKLSLLRDGQRNLLIDFLKLMFDGDGDPLRRFVHAEGGTGKTFMCATLKAILAHYGLGVLFCAHTGVAASHLPLGHTIDSLFPMNKDFRHLRDPTQYQKFLDLCEEGGNRPFLLIIDEVSMLTAARLAKIASFLSLHSAGLLGDKFSSQQAQARPFGDFHVLLLGASLTFFVLSGFLIFLFV